MNKNFINYQDFLDKYKSGEIEVLVDKTKAGDFVLSKFADKHYKPAHLFWSWLGIILILPAPVVFLLLLSWHYVIGSFLLGLIINSAAQKSAGQFVLQNMLDNEDFWDYVLLHKGATIKDKDGSEIGSEFLEKMSKKNNN